MAELTKENRIILAQNKFYNDLLRDIHRDPRNQTDLRIEKRLDKLERERPYLVFIYAIITYSLIELTLRIYL